MSPSLDAEGRPSRPLTPDVCAAELERMAAHEQLEVTRAESRAVVERARALADEIGREAQSERDARLRAVEVGATSALDQARAAAADVLAAAQAEASRVAGDRSVAERDAEAAHAAATRMLSETREEIARDAEVRRAAYSAEKAATAAHVDGLRRAIREAGDPDLVMAAHSKDKSRALEGQRVRARGTTGAHSAVLVGVLGLAIQAAGYALGWRGQTAPALPLWYAGLVLIAGAFTWAALRPEMSDRARMWLAVAFAQLVYLSWLISNPVMATRFDETLHVKTLLDLIGGGAFFEPHDLLPVSPFFPGLELATAGIRWLTGLPLMACQVLVVMLARAVLVVGLFWAARRLTGSALAASLAVVLYGASPQFYFFNSQFSYQTVAIAMLVAVMVCLLRSSDDERRWPWRHLLPGMACAGALAVTHHLTSWLTLGTLVALTVLFAIGREHRRLRLTATAAGLSAVVVVGWALLVGPTLVSYLLPIFESATSDVIAIFAGDGPEHAPGSGSGGVPTPLFEMGIMAGSILVWLAVLAPACWWAWRRRSIGGSVGRYLPLVLAAAYPCLHLMRFSQKAAEVGDRVSTFLFLALALVIGAWLARVVLRAPGVRLVALPGIVLAIVGGTVLGSGAGWARTTGPFLPAAEQRSVDAQSIAVARWLGEHIPPGSHVAADNTFNRLLPEYADVRMTTRPGGFRGAVEVFLGEDLGVWEMEILIDDEVDFLIADYRQADTRPYSGSLFEGSSGYGEIGSRLSSEQLDKFAEQPSFELVLDGPVKVYDLRSLRGEEQRFVDREVAPVPGGLAWHQAALTAALALLAAAYLLVRRRRTGATMTGLFLTLPALMVVGTVGVLTGMSPVAGVVLSAAALVVLCLRSAPQPAPGRVPWRMRERLLLGTSGLLLVGCVLVAGGAAADALFDSPVTLVPLGEAR